MHSGHDAIDFEFPFCLGSVNGVFRENVFEFWRKSNACKQIDQNLSAICFLRRTILNCASERTLSQSRTGSASPCGVKLQRLIRQFNAYHNLYYNSSVLPDCSGIFHKIWMQNKFRMLGREPGLWGEISCHGQNVTLGRRNDQLTKKTF